MTLIIRKAKQHNHEQHVNHDYGTWTRCGKLTIIPIVIFSISLATWATYYVAVHAYAQSGPFEVTGQWGKWSSWSGCSEDCGGGIMTRTRICANPLRTGWVKFCEGSTSETLACNSFNCVKEPQVSDVTGRLDSWVEWSKCSKDCGGGIRTRSRHCIGSMGAQCHDATEQKELCNTHICPIVGYWTFWSEWTLCTKTCDSGKRFRHRKCTKPSLPNGQHSCNGLDKEEIYCSVWSCPKNGQWTEWTEWTDCTASCGGGYRQRSRTCDDPPPSLGGTYCEGKAAEVSFCDAGLC